jgi:hypothetical protein
MLKESVLWFHNNERTYNISRRKNYEATYVLGVSVDPISRGCELADNVAFIPKQYDMGTRYLFYI